MLSMSPPHTTLSSPMTTSYQLQHDNNKDGYLTKDEVIQLSESLLVKSLLLSVTAQTDESKALSINFETAARYASPGSLRKMNWK
jgi:hypothetical protein